MFELNGIGTSLYGGRRLTIQQATRYGLDIKNNRISTEWLVIFGIPIYPFASYIVVGEGALKYVINAGIIQYSKKKYSLIKLDKKNWPQIFTTYFKFLLIPLTIVGFIIGLNYSYVHFSVIGLISFGLIFSTVAVFGTIQLNRVLP